MVAPHQGSQPDVPLTLSGFPFHRKDIAARLLCRSSAHPCMMWLFPCFPNRKVTVGPNIAVFFPSSYLDLVVL